MWIVSWCLFYLCDNDRSIGDQLFVSHHNKCGPLIHPYANAKDPAQRYIKEHSVIYYCHPARGQRRLLTKQDIRNNAPVVFC